MRNVKVARIAMMSGVAPQSSRLTPSARNPCEVWLGLVVNLNKTPEIGVVVDLCAPSRKLASVKLRLNKL